MFTKHIAIEACEVVLRHLHLFTALQIPAEMMHYDMTKTAQLAIAPRHCGNDTGPNVTVNCAPQGRRLKA